MSGSGLGNKMRRLKTYAKEYLDVFKKPEFYCNVCGRPVRFPYDSPHHTTELFEREKVVGAGFRPKSKCPLCASSDRLRFALEVMRRETDMFKSPCSILEMAPLKSTKVMIDRLNPGCDYVTGDIVPGRAMLVLDITHLDLPDERFDYAICNHVLEHIPDEKAAISELMRVLKPQGTLLLTMPICTTRQATFEDPSVTTEEARLATFGQEDHVRLYALDTANHLRSFGIDVREVIADESMADDIKRYRFIPGDRCFLCTKKQ